MRASKTIVFGLIALFTCNAFVLGQDRIDSLRSVLDIPKLPDSTYLKTCLEICKTTVNTSNEFLLPEYALKGLAIDTLNHDIQTKISLHQYLGNYYWQVGKLNESADQFNQIRMIGETRSDSIMTAKGLIGLGIVYYQLGDREKALDYNLKGLALSSTDTLLKVRFYNNIANSYIMQDKMDSVLVYYNKSIEYHKTHQNFRLLSIVYSNLALAYQRLHDGKAVWRSINLSLEAAKKTSDPYQIASVYQMMGLLAYTEHPEMAKQSFLQELELARKNKSYDQIRKSLEYLTGLADSTHEYKQEIAYLWELKNLNDTLSLDQKKSTMRQMEAEHIAAIKNAEASKKAQLEEIRILREKNSQRLLLIILVVITLAVLAITLMRMKTYQLRMKITRTKEQFFTMIAHDIRNPFSGILGLSGLLNEEAEKSDDPVNRKRVSSLHQSLTHVYELLDNLLQWSQAATGKIAFNPIVQALSPFIDDMIGLHTATAKQKGIRLENHVQSGLTARFDSNMLKTVIRNLLSNAIKFSPENSSIFISAEIQGAKVVVKVRDEGVGMSQEQTEKIFKADQVISTSGTRNETGTGLGLIMCRNFITRHGGRIWCESKPGEGTSMLFTLPD